MADRTTRIGDSLGRKIGPLPAGVWLGFVAVAAYLYQHRKGAGAQTPSQVPPPAASYYQTVGGSSSTYNLYGPRPTTSSPPRPAPPGSHTGGPLPPTGGTSDGPPPLRWPPPNPGPDRPGGGAGGVELPIVGAIGRFRLPALPLAGIGRRNSDGGELVGASAGMRATAKRATIRPALRAAQEATERAPGLVGVAALEGPGPERERRPMPPALSLRQRPAPPRITDPESQRNVKHEPSTYKPYPWPGSGRGITKGTGG